MSRPPDLGFKGPVHPKFREVEDDSDQGQRQLTATGAGFPNSEFRIPNSTSTAPVQVMRYYLLMNALRPSLAVILMLLAPVGISIANAQEALPFEIELPLSGVKVELNDCLLEVTIEPGVEPPVVRARELVGAVGEPATFSVGMGGGQVKITRNPHSEGTDPARAIVELVLDPRQPLHVIGRDIMLVVRAPRGGTDGADSAPKLPGEESAQGAAVSHTYELFDSEADLHGQLSRERHQHELPDPHPHHLDIDRVLPGGQVLFMMHG